MCVKTLILLSGLLSVTYSLKSYENYKVYDVVANTAEEVEALTELRDKYDFWTEKFHAGSTVRIMVSPNDTEKFIEQSKAKGMTPKLSISNIQQLINAQMQPSTSQHRNALGSLSWDQYYTVEAIHAWLEELVTLYPDVVSTIDIGRSHSGLPIKVLVIDFKRGERGDNPLIAMIEGGIHAREWISPATVTWIIKEFLTTTDSNVKALAENFVWHILPVTNPDGYKYTFTDNRFWRKNRNPSNYVSTCATNDIGNGIDLNRNFDYVWMSVGASSNPCTETYAGPSGASELETQALKNYVLTLKTQGNVVYYFAFHSFSQMILVPYSHVSGSNVLEADNYGDLYEIAIRGANKLEAKYGTKYDVGTSEDILYAVSGSSFDWAKGVAEIPITYLFELRDVGQYGFLLPPNQIVPNSEEIMDCLVEMDRVARQLRYYSVSGVNSVLGSFVAVILGLGLTLLM